MNTTGRFAITPVPPGQPAPDTAIVVGDMKEVMEYIPQSIARQDAIEELEKARFTADQISSLQEKTRAVQAVMLNDNLARLSARLDLYQQRRGDEERERAKEEEEAEAQRIQDQLNALPDPDDPDPFTHQNTGDLHALSPHNDMGGVPMSYRSIPTSYVRGKRDQSEFEQPEDPTGTVIPPPTAIEFDEV